MQKVGLVARYLKGGKDAPKLEPMLPYLQLLAWAAKHTTYPGVRPQETLASVIFL